MICYYYSARSGNLPSCRKIHTALETTHPFKCCKPVSADGFDTKKPDGIAYDLRIQTLTSWYHAQKFSFITISPFQEIASFDKRCYINKNVLFDQSSKFCRKIYILPKGRRP